MVITMVHDYDTPDISGLLYKKRGGLADKFIMNPWQFRLFMISQQGLKLELIFKSIY